ncbi:hypothetical protein [Streptomyces europaeiscabiei]|uniref:hypothetical protein n=1 Tax=Streptomyces europaeiscabiei TaxID=146819 RepID=UPI002E26F1E2|nr:hypothetical protein OG858_47870 [Streptomyces europaeiscabiei]
MPGNIGRQTVTLLEAPLTAGDYNSQVRDWPNAVPIPVSGCTVDYTSARENKQAANQTITTAQLDLPPSAPQVTAYHRVQWDGRTWEVDGVPRAVEASGPLSGQTVNLLEVTG